MSNANAGQVTWNLDIDSSSFDKKLAESKTSISGFSATLDKVDGSVFSFGKSLAGIGWSGLQVGASAAVGAVATLGIKGLTSGNQLQSLQLSMNGLTHSMDLGAQAMATAYMYAQKAPFQLPDVAGTTKTLIAYGLQVKDIGGYLNTLGNVSITTGVPLQSLGSIFGQVSAQGKLMLGDIRQLTQDGVAILPALQKQLGKTADDVQAMATAGEISFDQFNKALNSIVDPSILDQLNNTMPRAIDRLGGSIRIISNAFVGVGVDATNGFTQASNGIAQAATTLIGQLATSLRSTDLSGPLTSAGAAIAPFINAIVPFIPVMVNGLGSLIAHVQGLGAAFPLALAAGATGISGLAKDIPFVGELVGGLSKNITLIPESFAKFGPIGSLLAGTSAPLGLVVGLIGTLIAASPSLQSALGQVFQILGTTLQSLAPTFKVIGGLLSQFLDTLGSVLAPIIVALAQAFSQMLIALVPLIPPLLQIAILILQQVLIPILPIVVQLITMLANVFTLVMTALLPLMPQITSLITLLVGRLAPILPQLAQLLIQVVLALLPLLPPLLQLVTILLPPAISLLTVVANIFSTVLVAALTIAIGVFSDMLTLQRHLANAIGDLIVHFNNFLVNIKEVFGGVKNAVGDAIGTVLDWISKLPGKILGAIGSFGSTLYDAGRDLIQGFLNGAASLLVTIGEFFLNKLPAFIRDPFKKALGIHSPSTVFAGFGENITQGLANGIIKSRGAVDGAMSRLKTNLALSSTLSLGTGQGASGADLSDPFAEALTDNPSAISQPVVVNLNMSGIMARSRSDLRDIAKDMIASVNEELRARQLPQIADGKLSGNSTAA